MTKFVNSIKAALLKKQAAEHPDSKVDNTSKTKIPRPVTTAPNRPVKKVTGRGG